MPATKTYTTPGVFIAEKSAFPPSVVGVKTAVPAFIGYTEKAEVGGKPAQLIPVPVSSMADYEQKFGKEYKPVYIINALGTTLPAAYDFRVKQTAPDTYEYYSFTPESNNTYNLYNSMQLFYDNGGGDCYVVSVGPYSTTTAISDTELKNGIKAVEDQDGPTMLVVPDAVLLPPDGSPAPAWQSTAYGNVVTEMLKQCEKLQDRVAIIDVYGSDVLVPPTTTKLSDVITAFSTEVGDKGLSYGMAYFPELQTTVVPVSRIKYTNFDIADSTLLGAGVLQTLLTQEATNLYGATAPDRLKTLTDTINLISPTNSDADVKTYNDQLTASIPLLTQIEGMLASMESVLPPSGAVAGVVTYVDRTSGVWSAPANVTLASVIKPMVPINDTQQGDLNVPVDGKSIDVIRQFPGRGSLVWGARTLDGNSNDYRYIQVRRTLIYIEQSIKKALNQFVFAPNTGQTWTTVVSTISGFLQTVWSQGGLMGATASDAFTVQCGLGSTMTGTDILEGYMLVQVTLQMIRPAEFIELTFKQTMEGVA
jgi:phage tail sheath protein FI